MAEHAENLNALKVEGHLRAMLIEFLRAVSAADKSHRSRQINRHLWDFISSLADLPSEDTVDASELAISSCLQDARLDGLASIRDIPPVRYATQSAATAAAKVLAERMSSDGTQHRNAESKFFEQLRSWQEAREESMLTARRGAK